MFQRETQISPMIVSNMVQTQDEVLITNDLPFAGSLLFEGRRLTNTAEPDRLAICIE